MRLSQVEVIIADTHTARHIHHRLRYEVFCLETGFEDASRFPDQQEKDEFDKRAVPFLVRCKYTGTWLATARLILPGHGSLPIERHCNLARHTVPFDQMAEFSRLLITTHVRRGRRPSDQRRPHRSTSTASIRDRRHQRLETARILRELIRTMAAYGLDHGIPHAAFFITPALARILARMQIDLSVIGGAVRHRGLRFPFISRAAQVYGTLTRLAESDSGIRPPPYRSCAELQIGLDDGTMGHAK